MAMVVLSVGGAGLCNQLFSLVTGIIVNVKKGKDIRIGPFYTSYNSDSNTPISEVIDLQESSKRLGVVLTSVKTVPTKGSSFGWYTRHGEQQFLKILRGLRFHQSFYDEASKFIRERLDITAPIHVLHLRTEPDAMRHWAKMNKIPEHVFGNKLHSLYRRAIAQIPSGEQVLVLTYNQKDPILAELAESHRLVMVDTPDTDGREICALRDLLVGIECTGTFVGCHNFAKHSGSSFSYVLWRLMKNAKRGIFIDLDCIDADLSFT
jgi:hypothetical protein